MLDIDVEVTCSSGTYIRAIARDLGEMLGTGGHLTALRRIRVGPYDIGQARTLEQLAKSLECVPLAQAAAEAFPSVSLAAKEAWLASHGVRLDAAGGIPAGSFPPGPVAAFGPEGDLIALLAGADGEIRPLAVFVA